MLSDSSLGRFEIGSSPLRSDSGVGEGRRLGLLRWFAGSTGWLLLSVGADTAGSLLSSGLLLWCRFFLWADLPGSCFL